MELLINKNTVATKLQVAIGYNEQEFLNFIREAHEFDLKKVVPEDFYYDLLSNRTDPKWKRLIDGGEYAYKNRVYTFQGISGVLSYFTYARFILKSNVVSTSHGFTIKKTPHSEPLSLEERKNFYYSYQTDANTLLEEVKTFITRNNSDYQSWDCNTINDHSSRLSFATRVIK